MYYEEYKKGIKVNLNPLTFEIILLKSLIFHQKWIFTIEASHTSQDP
jgi:hypothetical protein